MYLSKSLLCVFGMKKKKAMKFFNYKDEMLTALLFGIINYHIISNIIGQFCVFTID